MGKSAAGSITIVGALVVVGAQIAALVGFVISEDDQQAIVNLINNGLLVGTTVVSMIGSGVAIWGRIRATKQITSILRSPKAE
jgi:tryptophan synthase alpha subunit